MAEAVPATLQKIVNAIKDKKIRKIVVLSGAGISTNCGLIDFRSPVTGLYAVLEANPKEYPGLMTNDRPPRPSPQKFFTATYFKEYRKQFYIRCC